MFYALLVLPKPDSITPIPYWTVQMISMDKKILAKESYRLVADKFQLREVKLDVPHTEWPIVPFA